MKALIQKLSRGRHRDDVNLTREEYQILCEIVVGERKLPRRRGRKADPERPVRDEHIATLVSMFTAGGNPTKVAVAKVCKGYGVSRSHVFAARRRHPMPPESK